MKIINLVLAFGLWLWRLIQEQAAAPPAADDSLLSALKKAPAPRVPEGPKPNKVECHTDKKEAKPRAIFADYLELLDFKGQPTLAPKTCNRVKCHNNSAIVWCNESEKELAFPNFDPIAKGAGAVLKECKVKDERKRRISGKSHFDEWSVKVEKSKC